MSVFQVPWAEIISSKSSFCKFRLCRVSCRKSRGIRVVHRGVTMGRNGRERRYPRRGPATIRRSLYRRKPRQCPESSSDSAAAAAAPYAAKSECPGDCRVAGDETQLRLESVPVKRFSRVLLTATIHTPNVHERQRTPVHDSIADLRQVLLRSKSVSCRSPASRGK